MAKPKPGTVYLVGAGPGDAGLLTVRGAELLRRAEVVVHDAILNTDLLRQVPAHAEIIAAGKRGAERVRSQEELNQLLVDKAREGKTVVRLKGGDPFVFGRGGEEACELARAGIPFEVIPGVSSFSAVPGMAGIPLTHREHASAFTVVTGHEDADKPGQSVDWRQLAQGHGTKVILMGVERLESISRALVEGGLAASTPIALIQWGTTARQKTVTGTLADIAQRAREIGLSPPAIAVIGEVVRLRDRLNWFESRPLFGRRVVVTRRPEQAGELVTRLAELGAEVLEIPVIRMGPPADRLSMVECLAGLGEYDWIVFTSANGVGAFFDALLAAYEDIRSVGNVRLAAVGPATAASLRRFHLRVDAMPAQFVGRQVADAIAKVEGLENLRILLARAQTANPDLCRELEERGAIVDDIAFYQTQPEMERAESAVASLRESGADWVTFTSASTVEHFHARIDLPALRGRHPSMRLASIGPETTRALEALSLNPDAEASAHTAEGLVQAILHKVRKSPSEK